MVSPLCLNGLDLHYGILQPERVNTGVVDRFFLEIKHSMFKRRDVFFLGESWNLRCMVQALAILNEVLMAASLRES